MCQALYGCLGYSNQQIHVFKILFCSWVILIGKVVWSHFRKNFHTGWLLEIKEHAYSGGGFVSWFVVVLFALQLHTFWVESDNYFTVTKPWFASQIPFPLSLILPGRMSKGALNRIILTRGEPPLYHLREVEAQVWLGLLSKQGASGGGTRETTEMNIPRCLPNRSSRVSFLLLSCHFILIRYTEMPRSA